VADLSAEDKEALKAAVELLWRKGMHTPQEADVAMKVTSLVVRLVAPAPQKDGNSHA
jgi:hypothetical protein